jgi:signal transduction histidine kinase
MAPKFASKGCGIVTNERTDFRILTAAGGPLLKYKTGDVVFKRGDAAQDLFIVQSGKVEIRLGNRVVETVSDNDIFGEMAMIDFAPRSATAVAISDTTLIPIGERQFLYLFSDLALDVMRVMVRRLRRRERENELMNIEAITASIGHEIKQPLAAIANNSSAARNFLRMAPPDLHEARALLNKIVDESHRASEILDGILSLFGKIGQARERIDVNEMTAEVLQSMRAEPEGHAVTTLAELTTEPPLVDGNRIQLQQVILNMVRNAAEAMGTTNDRDRVLRVKTERRGRDAIALVVQDSGRGIDPNQLDRIFDPFVSTKAHGMGLGLAICRMIIERHGGELTASSDGESGALFQFVLPSEPMDRTITPVEYR